MSSLLLANLIVYVRVWESCSGAADADRVAGFLLGMTLPQGGSQVAPSLPPEASDWAGSFVFYSAFVGMAVVTLSSIKVISDLREREEKLTSERLFLLGYFESWFSPKTGRAADAPSDASIEDGSGGDFVTVTQRMLAKLCDKRDDLWFFSACLWLQQRHEDRGQLLVPVAPVRFDEAKECADGVDADVDYLGTREVRILPSLSYPKADDPTPRFREGLDAPAGFVPLTIGEERLGTLSFYGVPDGPPIHEQDGPFLRSLGAILASALHRQQSSVAFSARREIDALLKKEDLESVFDGAAKILQRYLAASACMVIFRPDPRKDDMEIKSHIGFRQQVRRNHYHVGLGRTGRCARRGRTDRVDDVTLHRGTFDATLLRNLEQTHGGPIHSWMAIPIGPKIQNFGVIKVVNRKAPYAWFTDFDQTLGEELGTLLHLVIERFLNEELAKLSAEKARVNARRADQAAGEARRSAQEATDARAVAEREAKVYRTRFPGHTFVLCRLA